MKKNVTLLAFLVLSLCLFSQEKTNSLQDQFTDVIDKSNRYEDYKVVKIFKLNNLRKNVMDSIATLEKTIEASNGRIDAQQGEIETLTQNLKTTQDNLTISKQKEDGIQFFGAITKKSTYNAIMWTIIGLLLLGLAFLFIKFKSSHSVTKAAELKLSETEEEFENHRQRTLEREQQLRRKLQDEINKHKKVQ